MAQQMAQQPPRVAAGTAAPSERLLRQLHARFEPDEILEIALKPLIEGDQKVNGAERRFRCCQNVTLRSIKVGGKLRCQRTRFEKQHQILLQQALVRKWKIRRGVFEEEIEWVKDGHFCDQFDLDAELLHLVLEDEPRVPV